MWSRLLLGAASTIGSASLGFGVLAVIVAGPLGYFGAFGQTGSDYFRECWAKSVATEAQNRRDPVAATASQAVAWAKCEATATAALVDLGFQFGGLDSERAVWDNCPRAWDLRVAGSEYYRMTVQLIVKSGGPEAIDLVWPADRLVAKVWADRWPKCKAIEVGRLQPGDHKPISTPSGAVTIERTK